MYSIIDGDIVAYRVAAASEDTDEDIARLRADKLVRDILYMTDAATHNIYISGSNNFRYKLYPEYKANRKDMVRPRHLEFLKQFLISEWKAIRAEGCEADDMLGVEVTRNPKAIVCSIDKDLLQLEGRHYNFVKNEWYDIDKLGGLRNFYEQLLKGDRSDNIPGIPGIGNVKAARFLEGCESEQQMFTTCQDLYEDDQKLLLNGRLLWIWRTEGDIWNPSHLETGMTQSELKEGLKFASTTQKEGETSQSTELGSLEMSGYPVDGQSTEDTLTFSPQA